MNQTVTAQAFIDFLQREQANFVCGPIGDAIGHEKVPLLMLRYWNPSSAGRRTGPQITPSQLHDQYASHKRGDLLPEIVTLATSQTVPGELPTPSPFAEQHATQGLAARQATKLLSGRAGGPREVFVAAWPVAAEILAWRAI
ncbi:MAG: hypothetical protein KJO70_05635, partial [Gammaproteobacteria bacterium]|nr:hypothetical protein [Gammaproteobacteria bacterium]